MTESIQIILVVQSMNISSDRPFANTWTLGLICRKYLYFSRFLETFICFCEGNFYYSNSPFYKLFECNILTLLFLIKKNPIFFFWAGTTHLIKFVCILNMYRREFKREVVWWNETITKEIRMIRTIENEI